MQFTKKKTLEFLTELDEKLAKDGYQAKFKLYCMGGTKMILSDLRYSSDDVDFLTSREDFRVFSSYIPEFERQKVRFDVFPEGELPGYGYKEYKEHAKRMPYRFKHLDIYFIDDIDFVITKALAGREKDIKDLKILFKKKIIPKEKLLERFQKIKFKSDKERELKEKFDEFIRGFYGN